MHIPRIILIHSATLEHRTGTNADGDGVYDTAVSLFFVRCEPVKAWAKANVGEMADDKLVLFYDCVNSEPVGVSFALGDRITFNGQAYTVRECKSLFADSDEAHHFEVALK